ncbi:MAG TPA: mandelate racemase/muconate lactonizing enzyme family protein [Casimicrobiaceae bacterium]|nr:mandelate racemase/muconate lactonizing enzyme family protein [Casimicrobiaceae bacterium]
MTRVAAVKTHAVGITPRTNWVFVELTTDDGITGVGEASLNGWEPLLLAYAERLRGAVEGADVAGLERATRYLPHSPGGLVAHAVRSALEQAWIDNDARRTGVPVYAYLGGARRTHVPVYANINRATTDRSPAGCAAGARQAVEAGFRAVKIAPFDGAVAEDRATTPFAERVAAGVERVLAMRDAIGPDVALLVDCHWRLDAMTASDVIRALEPARLYWLECPVSEHVWQLDTLARLRAVAHEHGMRLAGAETVAGVDEIEPFLARGCYDVVMPDLKYCGGYRGLLAIATAAQRHGVEVSPHNPTGPICNLGSVHACAAMEHCLSLEYQLAESPLYTELVGGVAPALVDGEFAVPDGPGLGATLDAAVVAAHPWHALPAGTGLDERLG